MFSEQSASVAAPALDAYCAQRPVWRPSPDDPDLDHAEIEVPQDYAHPGGERLTIALSRSRARDPRRRRGILLAVNGGPGGDWGRGRALVAALCGTPTHDVYDLIGFDPRGTGDSTRLYAEVAVPKAPFDSRPPDAHFAQIAEDMRVREAGCARAGGALRPHVSTRNTARDMDVIRAVLDEERLSFVGYAYGSYVGAVYGTMFPERLDRSVLDSCVHPGWTWYEQFVSQGDAILRNVRQWARWAGDRDSVFGLGVGAEAVLESVERAVRRLEELPEGVDLRTLLDGAMGYRTADRGAWGRLGRIIARLMAGPGGEAGAEQARSLLADQRGWRPTDHEGELRSGVLDAVTLEHDWPTDLAEYFTAMRDFRVRYPYGYGVLRAQPWVGAFRSFTPAEPPTKIVRNGFPTGLVVQADGDIMDHHDGGVAMAEQLGHRLITVTDSGDHEVFVLAGNAEVDALVHRYLTDGVLPPAGARCAGATPRPDIPADPGRG
ncbi:alpha/beta fold hydrolase [Streptomyces sp. NPDC088729]|uniref:alpha/beta fold hydrolase n=1 Tax=Streptomyces sp. NPDC088729 TaxID=3365876 RepID=UPI0037F196B8